MFNIAGAIGIAFDYKRHCPHYLRHRLRDEERVVTNLSLRLYNWMTRNANGDEISCRDK